MTTQSDHRIHIEFAPDGVHIAVEYSGSLAGIPAAVEKLRAAGILELVQANRIATSNGSAKPRAERVQPEYAADGTPQCPKHHKPLKEGQWGLFCPAKDDTTERGYCALKFRD